MTCLELASARVPLRRSGREHHGPCPACGHGANSTPQTSDRFWVNEATDRWYCRQCDPKGGGPVKFLMKFEGKSCPEAHAALGLTCDSSSCPARDKCKHANVDQPRRPAPAPRPLQPPAQPTAPTFTPQSATAPATVWQEHAAKIVDLAHSALLDCPEQLAYLARRGLPREAVERYRLGWLGKDEYRSREAWGLPTEYREDKKPKKLWLPQGIVIPFFTTSLPCTVGEVATKSPEGSILRLRIRRHTVKEGEARYYWVPGSGDDVPVIGTEARAFVVVESDLDALVVHHAAGDLVGSIPLGTCSAKPKAAAHALLTTALCVLICLDADAAGAKASQWWTGNGRDIHPAFPRAKRWPVPAGKDPGDYVKDHGGDIRAWVLQGLPPIFKVAPPPIPLLNQEGGADRPGVVASAPTVSATSLPCKVGEVAEQPPEGSVSHAFRHTVSGQIFHVAPTVADAIRVWQQTGQAVFTRAEIDTLKAAGHTPATTIALLNIRATFGFDGKELTTGPIDTILPPIPDAAFLPSPITLLNQEGVADRPGVVASHQLGLAI